MNLQPSGKYLMEDFCYAGGLPAVMRELGGLLHGDALTVTRRSVAENVRDAPCWNRDVIMPLGAPFQPAGTGTAVLRGNLAPDGAVIKQSAARRTCSSTAAVPSSSTRLRPTTRSPPTRTSTWTKTRSWSSATAARGLPGHAGDRQRAAARQAAQARRP